jgi:outer membrane protein
MPEQQWQATVNLQWNLFSGFQTDSATQEARINVAKVSSEFANTKLAIKQETDNAYILVFKNKDAVKLSENLVKAAGAKFEQSQKRYEHGLSDYIELQEARQSYINAQTNLVISYYEYFIALAQLDRAVGR